MVYPECKEKTTVPEKVCSEVVMQEEADRSLCQSLMSKWCEAKTNKLEKKIIDTFNPSWPTCSDDSFPHYRYKSLFVFTLN